MSNIYSQILKCAVIKKDIEEIKYCLAKGADVNQRIRKNNETFLHYTTSLEIIKQLLLFGADVNARDRLGQTPLHSAIANKKELRVIRTLLSHGADINARDNYGETVLHCALLNGNELLVIRELLRNHVDVNAVNDCGDVALHLAVRWGNGTNLDIVRELLEFGADATCNIFPTSLYEAFGRHFDTCAKLIMKMTVLKKYNENKGIKPYNYINSNIIDLHTTYLEKCIREVIQMRANKISGNLSLFDFVKRKGGYIKAFYSSEKIVPAEIIAKYPIYSDIILTNMKLSSDRAFLLEEIRATQICTVVDSSNKKVVLNIDCVHKICEYLTNEHLSNILIAFKGYKYLLSQIGIPGALLTEENCYGTDSSDSD